MSGCRDSRMQLLWVVIAGVAKFVGNILAIIFVDAFGRLKLLKLSAAVSIAEHSFFANISRVVVASILIFPFFCE